MRSFLWLACCSLPVVLGACGGAHVPRPVVATAAPTLRHEDPCRGAEGALAELEAVRQARDPGEELGAVLHAERGVLDAAQVRRASTAAANAIFAGAEQDASARSAALERYTVAVEGPDQAAHEAASRLDNHCAFRRFAAKASKPAKKPARGAAPLLPPDCERLAQLSPAVRWHDAASVRAYGDAVATLSSLPAFYVRDAAEKSRVLAAALRGVAADRVTFTAPRESLPEAAVTALYGQCRLPSPALPSLVVAPDESARGLTVIVAAKAPLGLGAHFERAASSAPAANAPLYRSIAGGRYGSGFVVVMRGEDSAAETFIVTNRHVADLASSLTVKVEGGGTVSATPVFVDPGYDIAILSPSDRAAPLAPRGGLDIARTAPIDGDEVTALGYPGLMGEPSFQLTKGHVSNASLVFADGAKLSHVQHTAAIDPGSSGGPLLGARREVLGVNTFKLMGREAVGIAVPASAVARALASARAASHCDGACKKKAAEDACLALVSELARPEPNATSIQRMLGEEIVGTHGIQSHNTVVRTDPSIYGRFQSSPIATLSEAVARKLVMEVSAAGGVQPLETCSEIRHAKTLDGNTFHVAIALKDGARELVFAWDRARWRLADFPFDETDDEEEAPPPPPVVKKKPAAAMKKKS